MITPIIVEIRRTVPSRFDRRWAASSSPSATSRRTSKLLYNAQHGPTVKKQRIVRIHARVEWLATGSARIFTPFFSGRNCERFAGTAVDFDKGAALLFISIFQTMCEKEKKWDGEQTRRTGKTHLHAVFFFSLSPRWETSTDSTVKCPSEHVEQRPLFLIKPMEEEFAHWRIDSERRCFFSLHSTRLADWKREREREKWTMACIPETNERTKRCPSVRQRINAIAMPTLLAPSIDSWSLLPMPMPFLDEVSSAGGIDCPRFPPSLGILDGEHFQVVRNKYHNQIDVSQIPTPERVLVLFGDEDRAMAILADLLPLMAQNQGVRPGFVELRAMIHSSQAGAVIVRLPKQCERHQRSSSSSSRAKVAIESRSSDRSTISTRKSFPIPPLQIPPNGFFLSAESYRISSNVSKVKSSRATFREASLLAEVYAILDQTPIRGPIRNYDPSFYDGVDVERYGEHRLSLLFIPRPSLQEGSWRIMISKPHVFDSMRTINSNSNTTEGITTIEVARWTTRRILVPCPSPHKWRFLTLSPRAFSVHAEHASLRFVNNRAAWSNSTIPCRATIESSASSACRITFFKLSIWCRQLWNKGRTRRWLRDLCTECINRNLALPRQRVRFAFVTSFVELRVPIPIGVQTLIGVASGVVVDRLAEGLRIPNLHVRVELFHFTHQHQWR